MAAAAATAAAATPSRAAPSAESYIGSLISLTSKSEIRYEGVLYNINTEESSIGLRNVRSFGTEGRKKDGQQVPPSDKIYEYILFRGGDIKDLQVKSSPPVQPAPPIHSDPAIIQSQYSRPAAPASISTGLPSVGSGTVADLSSHATQMIAPRSTFQSGLPLYQPGGSLGPWGPSPPPAPNGSGLAMPMYWQGFYAPSGGMPHLQPPPLLRPPGPPPGMPIPHSMHQPLQYTGMSPPLHSGSQNLPGANVLLQSGSSNFTAPNASTSMPGNSASLGFSDLSGISASLPSAPSNLPGITASSSSGSTNVPGTNMFSLSGSLNFPEFPRPLLPPVGSSLISATLPSSTQATSLDLDTPISPVPNKPPVTSLPSAPLSDSLPFVSSLSSSLESTVASAGSKPKSTSGTESVSQFTSSSISSVTGSSSPSLAEASMPPLSTNSQLLQAGSSTLSSTQPLQKSHKATEVKPASSSEPQKQSPIETKDAILPLPRPSDQKQNEAPLHTHHSNRGRGRGRGNAFSRTATKFTEDFDFTAMNEKFKKDEVWGHLGKSRGHLRDREGNEDESNDDGDDDIPEEDSEGYSKFEVKPVYVKDDFFDSLSCNALDGGARNGRTKFSEQRKIDTETFGDISRHRAGRGGGRGFRGGGRARGSFYGRGYRYTGRGRGHAY